MNESTRNELLKQIDVLCDMVNTVVYDKCTYDEYSNMCDIIGNIETLIEDEPIDSSGHWEKIPRRRTTLFSFDDNGEMIYSNRYKYMCSICHQVSLEKTRFCPHCGVKMKEEN